MQDLVDKPPRGHLKPLLRLKSGHRFLLFVALLFGLSLTALTNPSAARAEAVTLGDMTLEVDEEVWQARHDDGKITLRCLSDTVCESVTLALSVRENSGAICDKEDARRQAEARFPGARSYSSNILPAPALALVVAQARFGPDATSPIAAFGCVTRNGRIYEIATVKSAQPFPRFSGGTIHALFQKATMRPLPPQSLTVGGLTFSFDVDRWRVDAVDEAAGTARLSCNPPTCRDWKPHVSITASDGESECAASDAAELYPMEEAHERPPVLVQTAPGQTLLFHVTDVGSMCRNWVPPQLHACATHDGKTYRLASRPFAGCRSSSEVPDDAFRDLVGNARPAR